MNNETYLRAIRCSDCRFWKTQPPSSDWVTETIEEGVCGRIHEDQSPTHTFNHFGDDSGLITAPDFGCVLGELNPHRPTP